MKGEARVAVDGFVTPLIDHVPWALGQRFIALAEYVGHKVIVTG